MALPTYIPYSTPLNFPEIQVENMDLGELRRYVRELSFFPFERALYASAILSADAVNYQMDGSEHSIIVTNTGNPHNQGIYLPRLSQAHPVVYYFKNGSLFASAVVITSHPSDTSKIDVLSTSHTLSSLRSVGLIPDVVNNVWWRTTRNP